MNIIRKYFDKPEKSDWIIIGFYWFFALFFIIPEYLNDYTLYQTLFATLYNVIIDTSFILILIYFVLPFSLKNKKYWFVILMVVLVLIFSVVFYKLGYGFILNQKPHWNMGSIFLNVIRQAQSYGILLSILAMKKFYSSQQNILNLEKVNAESNLKVLSNQIAPHFLFNNLNVLQSLIQSNPNQATVFVKHLSAIYRYLIKHKDEEVVVLQEELNFATAYIYLLNQRFGNAYIFETKITNETALFKIVPTCCLQVLLENIVKHNQGNEQNPLFTTLEINENEIMVRNEIRPKINQNDFSGTGLQNLNERYQLLSNQNIRIEKSENFKVILPLIKQLKQY
jgi:two-component system, LytTR family, sensor kinase